jgi:hypothetical protein
VNTHVVLRRYQTVAHYLVAVRPITCNKLYVRVEEQFINIIIYIKLLAYYYYYCIDFCFKGMKWRDHTIYIKGIIYKQKYVTKFDIHRSVHRDIFL